MSIFTFTTMGVALLTGSCRLKIRKMVISILLIIGAFALAIICLKLGFTDLIGDNYHGGEIIGSMDLPKGGDGKRLNEIVMTKVYLSPDEVPASNNATLFEDPIKRIKDRGALRVGYNANDIPFIFFNKNGSLVGYDVQMAYELALFLGVPKIEFVPITGDTLAEQLNSGQCDIIMSSIIVTPKRLEEMRFTDSYMTVHMAFVVRDERQKEFMKLSDVQKSDHLRIAVLNRTALVNESIFLFPNADIIRVDSLPDFFVGDKADALLTTAEEGSVMTLLYPFYTVALFQPSNSYQMLYAYPVAKGQDDSFLMILNYWLKMEREYSQLDDKYDYWILGKNVVVDKPRWSVAKDVLHWFR
ncbi:MAG TPA: ABC transporter substrate-binding protein [Methanotrichaceae archaeon]|nr:ABC transporter substrate-binding protein [Methanotrichaceae archaeon]